MLCSIQRLRPDYRMNHVQHVDGPSAEGPNLIGEE